MIHPKVFRAIPRITSFFKNKNFLDIFILSISNNIKEENQIQRCLLSTNGKLERASKQHYSINNNNSSMFEKHGSTQIKPSKCDPFDPNM